MTKDKIHIFCWFSFALIVMIDPSGEVLHIKDKAFIGIFCISAFLNKLTFNKKLTEIFLKFIFCVALSIILGALFYGGNIADSIWYFKAILFITFFSVICRYNYVTIIKLNAYVGLFLSCIISLLYIGYLTEYIPIEALPESNVFLSYRPFLGIPMTMFFYRTMPFCFFALIFFLEKNKIYYSCVIIVSIVAGASRTPILCALCIILYVIYIKNKKFLKYAIGICAMLLVLWLFVNLTSSENKMAGDDIKYRLIHDLFWNSGLIPHGAGMAYWDASRREFTISTEVTYFEMLYQYGWILFPIMMYFLIYPIIKIAKYKKDTLLRDFSFAYLIYLINAGTNPLLFSSTGMYVYACALAIAKDNLGREVLQQHKYLKEKYKKLFRIC